MKPFEKGCKFAKNEIPDKQITAIFDRWGYGCQGQQREYVIRYRGFGGCKKEWVGCCEICSGWGKAAEINNERQQPT
jgi:hypothetical protein